MGSNADIEIGLVGHPYAPIGRGEDVRCTFRALRSVAGKPRLIDVYGANRPEPDAIEELQPYASESLCPVNVFHINGDEVDHVLATLGSRRRPADAVNVVYPAWELERYPEEWSRQLERFDEVWAPSLFIMDALKDSVTVPVVHMPLACEVILSYFLGRRWFGIPESAYAFLFFFDFRSYVARKNPEAVLAAFRKLLEQKRYANCVLVIKVHGAEAAPAEIQGLKERLAPYRDRILLIDRTLTDNEVKNLVRVCDSFVSLHRSEGFGRGLIEAMYLGKPVIGTRYSGNLDFMNEQNSLLVDCELIPLTEGQYPHWQGQVWADADVDQAARYMAKLVDQPELGRQLGGVAARHVRAQFGLRPAGVRYLERLKELVGRRRMLRAETATATESIERIAPLSTSFHVPTQRLS